MAGSFDAAAELYERARPSYPQQAVDWLLESAPRRVLDLGAGTGKLTRLLAGRVDVMYAPFDRQSLLELVGSRSYVISAPPDERAAIMRGVDDLLDNHPALQDEANWRLPYRTEAFRIRLA